MKRDVWFGVDCYPEQWPRDRWEQEMAGIKELGANVVRLAEFGWAVMEPEPGRYDWSLFDEAIERFHRLGIRVILGTPTATPPAWLVRAHPEILPVAADGQVKGFGGRRHYCYNSPVYREHSRRIVTAMAERWGHHPAVVGWQVDNELGHEGSDKCYCDTCRAAFQRWLAARYGSLRQLNETWGTVFWSQTYTDWEQIPVPRLVTAIHNPALLLDYHRFCSDSIVSYAREQVEILRPASPGRWITHNFVPPGQALRAPDLAEHLDFASYDNYPVWGGLKEPIPPEEIAFRLDWVRSLSGSGYLVMEELIGAQGWNLIGYLPRPGQARLWTMQALARGAGGFVYFRWRANARGAEQFCHAVVDHDGRKGRKFAELQAVGRELQQLEAVAQAPVQARAALLFSHDNLWAWQIQPLVPGLEIEAELRRFHGSLFRHGVLADLVHAGRGELSGYRLVLAPLLKLASDQVWAGLEAWVRQGGVLVLTWRAGSKDESSALREQVLPGPARPMAGVSVREYEALGHGRTVGLRTAEGQPGTGERWADLLELEGAEPLAFYESTFYAGTPAITRHAFGKGWVYYVGTSPDQATLDRVMQEAFNRAGLPWESLPEGCERVERGGFRFDLNHGEMTVKVARPGGADR
ncbi:MAG: beta-galactosidase [Bacillota bacterium]